MAGKRSTRSSPCTRNCADGYTLIELLVALAVASALLGATLVVAMSSRESYTTDQNRTRTNQNLRAALDLVGIEIRQSGERLPSDFPALEIVDGAQGAPDRLILRRNLLDEVLPLCQRLQSGSTDNQIQVAHSGSSPPRGCVPLSDTDGNGWPDNIDSWRAHRDANGGVVRAYVYNPVQRQGEWFEFDGDGTDADHLSKGNDDPWQFTHEIAQQCRVYVLEEREYGLEDELLVFLLNAAGGEGIHLSAGITDFQTRAVLADGTTSDSLDASADWSTLRAIELDLTGESSFDDRTIERSVSARFFPRNILSN